MNVCEKILCGDSVFTVLNTAAANVTLNEELLDYKRQDKA